MRDAQRLFAAIEDQRHDYILLVVEMAAPVLDQAAARQHVVVAHALSTSDLSASARQRIAVPWSLHAASMAS